jgi:hypothetical protein
MYRGGGRALPGAIRAILIASVAVFLLQSVLRVWGPEAPLSEVQFIEIFGLVPVLTLLHGWIWQPITYLFLHGNLFHLLLNLLMLWMFGVPLERAWGTRRFLRYYFVCGAGAAALTCLVAFSSRTIGASGAGAGAADLGSRADAREDARLGRRRGGAVLPDLRRRRGEHRLRRAPGRDAGRLPDAEAPLEGGGGASLPTLEVSPSSLPRDEESRSELPVPLSAPDVTREVAR